MSPGDIYHKTEKGIDEIAHRTQKLPQKMRTMLIMIDGIKTADVLFEQARQLGVESGFLIELEQGGFIASSSGPLSADEESAEPHVPEDADKSLRAE